MSTNLDLPRKGLRKKGFVEFNFSFLGPIRIRLVSKPLSSTPLTGLN